MDGDYEGGVSEACWRLSRARRGESNIISCDQRVSQRKGERDQNHEGARGEKQSVDPFQNRGTLAARHQPATSAWQCGEAGGASSRLQNVIRTPSYLSDKKNYSFAIYSDFVLSSIFPII